MNIFKKALLATALIGATSVANAGLPFTVDPSVSANIAPTLGASPFEADLAGARYLEDVTFFADSTFQANILAQVTSFSLDSTVLGPGMTGLELNYGLYASIDVMGNFSGAGSTINLGGFSGELNLWLDANNDSAFSTFSGVEAGDSAVAVDMGATADILLASSTDVSGSGIGNTAAGGFTFVFSDIALTSGSAGIDGDEFFVAPAPFHTVGISTGDLGDDGSSLQDIDLSELFSGLVTSVRGAAAGDTSIEFVEVSAPTALSIMGLGLALMGFNARRRK